MNCMRSIYYLLLPAWVWGAPAFALQTPVTNIGECANAINVPSHNSLHGLEPSDPLRVLSWNVHKGKDQGWQGDLERLAQGADLVLLQEAIPDQAMLQPNNDSVHWSFAPGYEMAEQLTGVLTTGRFDANLVCHIQHYEPWIKTPKATNIMRYSVQGYAADLLVINTHVINFTIGTRAFKAQLADIEHALASHQGPVILAGDFNTWRAARMSELRATALEYGLTEIVFENDRRSFKFGHALDHMFVKGLKVNLASSWSLDSSDHNPLFATLEFEPVEGI